MTDTILVVDDSKTIRMSMNETLGRLGFTIALAESAEDALAQVQGGVTAKLVITDYNMPGKNGVELIEELRKHPKYRFCPMLVLTTETQQDLRAKAKSAGATGWLIKPVNAGQLVQVVQQVMPKR